MADNVHALYQAVLSGNRGAVDAAMSKMGMADVPVVMSFFNGLPMADKQALATVFDKNPGIVPVQAQGTIRSALADVPRGAAQQPTQTRSITPQQPVARPVAQQTPARLQQQPVQPQRGFLQPAARPTMPPPAQRPAPQAVQPARGPVASAFMNGSPGVGGSAAPGGAGVSYAFSTPNSGYGGLDPHDYGMAATVAPAGWSFSGGLYSR